MSHSRPDKRDEIAPRPGEPPEFKWRLPGTEDRAGPFFDLGNPKHKDLWARISGAMRLVPKTTSTFKISDIEKVAECPSGLREGSKGEFQRRDVAREIIRMTKLVRKIRAIVLDRAICGTENHKYEAYSTHASTDRDERHLFAIARLERDASPEERAEVVLDHAFDAIAKRLLPPGTPFLARQPEASIEPIRAMLAEQGMGYALRLADDAIFSCVELPPDVIENVFARDDPYLVRHAFAQLIKARTAERRLPVPIIPTKCLVNPSTGAHLTEYLVLVSRENENHLYIARPQAPSPNRPRHLSDGKTDKRAAMELANRAHDLPAEPLLAAYRGLELHHPNHVPWENLILSLAHLDANELQP